VLRSGDPSGRPLVRLADIQQVQVGAILRVLGRHWQNSASAICAACGRPIPAERLELVPETPYCVEDAAKLRV